MVIYSQEVGEVTLLCYIFKEHSVGTRPKGSKSDFFLLKLVDSKMVLLLTIVNVYFVNSVQVSVIE